MGRAVINEGWDQVRVASCHRWLTFWVEKEGSLYYHFCVFVKAKK